MTNRAQKTFTIASGEVIFDINDSGPSVLSANHDQNIVSISTTAALTGSFDCFVEYEKDGGFLGVQPIGGTGTSIDAATVGSQVADGSVSAWSFNGSPNRVKVTATTVVGAATVDVVVSQNHG